MKMPRRREPFAWTFFYPGAAVRRSSTNQLYLPVGRP